MAELRTGLAVTNFVMLLFDDFYFGICTWLAFESALLCFLTSSIPQVTAPEVFLLDEAPPVTVALAELTD